jgi:hypothetical protein
MPMKRRFSKERDVVVTDTAVKTFEQMRQLSRECTCAAIDWAGEYDKREQCSACRQWWELHSFLHKELKRKLWQWPCVENPSARSPYPKGSPADLAWQPDLEAQDVWRVLRAASKARRAARAARHANDFEGSDGGPLPNEPESVT